jgi:hypothetical protein
MRFWKYRDGDGPVDANGVAPGVTSPTTIVHPTTVVERTGPSDGDVRAAYDRGRQDERASRHSHPIITLLVVLLAIVGALAIWLLVRNNGSAVRAGVDAQNQAAHIRAEAPGAIHEAGQTVGQAARTVGAKVNQATDTASDAPASQ